MSFYREATFQVGPTRVSPIQDQLCWKQRATAELGPFSRSGPAHTASPGPYRWELVHQPGPPVRRRGKAPKDLDKEILTAHEMQREALAHLADVWNLKPAGISFRAHKSKPTPGPPAEAVLALPELESCLNVSDEVEAERRKRQEAEDEVERLRRELRACRSCTTPTSARTGSCLASRQSWRPSSLQEDGPEAGSIRAATASGNERSPLRRSDLQSAGKAPGMAQKLLARPGPKASPTSKRPFPRTARFYRRPG